MLAGHSQQSINALSDDLKYRLIKRLQTGTAGWRGNAIQTWRLICTVYQIARSSESEEELPSFEMLFPENKHLLPTPLPQTKKTKEQIDDELQKKLAEKLAHKFDRG